MGIRLSNRKIAIGVGDSALRASIQASLERESADVSSHETLESLLEGVDLVRPDLCLVDIDLLGLLRDPALERLRSLSRMLPLVLLTGHVARPELAQFEDLPTLTLPFRRAELLTLIEGLLRHTW
jgi:DNA-binding response OmpR family regulator